MKLVVARHGDEPAGTRTEGVEYLGGGITPHLKGGEDGQWEGEGEGEAEGEGEGEGEEGGTRTEGVEDLGGGVTPHL